MISNSSSTGEARVARVFDEGLRKGKKREEKGRLELRNSYFVIPTSYFVIPTS